MKVFFRSFIITLTCLIAACGGQEDSSTSDENQTVSLVASVDTNSTEVTPQSKAKQALNRKAIQSSLSEINRITLEAVLVTDSTQSLTIELTEDGGIYSAELELLADQQYQFTANAYIDEEITYTGTTFQIPIEGGAVNISLSHVDAGSNNVIPQINQIIRDDIVEQGTNVNFSFAVTGSTGELLTYEITGASGSFTPNSGEIQLPESSSSARVVVSYQAPIGNEAVEFDYALKLTNSHDNSVITAFSISVAPIKVDNNVSVSFNPVIKGVTVQRNANQLTWTLDVDTIAGEAYLQYVWSFEASAGSAQFAIPDANPGVMDGYDETTAGRIALTVTDNSANGGVSTYNYEVNAGDYPDTVIVNPMEAEKITIDFSPATLPNGSRCENEPFTRESYLFTPADTCGVAISNHDDTENVWLNLNGRGDGSTLTAPNNTLFTIYSMDIAEYSTVFAYPQTVRIACVKNGLATYINIYLDGVITDSNDMFQTFQLEDECTNIDEFRFGGTMSADNIVISRLQ
ncbi:MAG: hypothetical protein V7785_20240 [Bermanella sp.]